MSGHHHRRSLPLASAAAAPEAPRQWRSVEEWLGQIVDDAGTDLDRFADPPGRNEISRREFIRLLGASAAFAGLAGCVQPAEYILPYVEQPPELTPGEALHYATSMTLGGYATGLIVESHVGRPTKIEGNPQHPASLGAAGVIEQASILQLYDPNRARLVRRRRAGASWSAFRQWLRALPGDGDGLHLLLEPTTSPMLATLLDRVRESRPRVQTHFYAPLADRNTLAGARLAFGRPLLPVYDLDNADVVVAIDADLLASTPFHLRYARQFTARRRLRQPGDAMNRLWVAESMLSVTGGFADHRLRVRPTGMAALLLEMMAELRRLGLPLPDVAAPAAESDRSAWVVAAARDLAEHPGRCLVAVGETQPPHVHALAHVVNTALGSAGWTVSYAPSPVVEAGEPSHDPGRLTAALDAGAARAVLVLDGNPSYASPAGLELSRRLRQAPSTAYLGLYENETAGDCEWMVPMAHYLERWGDARAWDGTLSLIQPLIEPLFGGRSVEEVLAVIAGEDDLSPRERLRAGAAGTVGGSEGDWAAALQRGLVPDTAFAPVAVTPGWGPVVAALEAAGDRSGRPPDAIDITFTADPRLHDGRFANNPWLQEMPEPMTMLTWGNAAIVSATTAGRLGLSAGGGCTLEYGGRTLTLPVLILPGHADDAVTLRFGYGREGGEAVARGVGLSAYALWRGAFTDGGAVVHAAAAPDGTVPLALTQTHWTMEGRAIALSATLDAYRRDPDFTAEHRGVTPSLYHPFEEFTGNQWAMTIDLSRCTGCGACAVACQAENNVPVVGREGVLRSREMHWLRIDRYFTGSVDDPEIITQPMLCQHCEKAPCEYVCPVNATVHSTDGLNEMVYNRCVGTRFCSNNCPYKVRRFNWFDYNAELAETEEMARNPDVTVRSRGVMEKCTFCVQRIREGEIAARVAGRELRPGEIRTACQQACPTEAIVFGSLTQNDRRLHEQLAAPRRYVVLHELGTEPRVHYLARITNPRRDLDAGPA